MAIEVDNASYDSADTDELTFSHEVSGDDRVLVVVIHMYRDTDQITGVTYNGTPMTRQVYYNRADGIGCGYIYTLVNPSTGVNNVVISSNVTEWIGAVAISLTGADTSNPIDATADGSFGNGNISTVPITTNHNNSMIIDLSFAWDTDNIQSSGQIQRWKAVDWGQSVRMQSGASNKKLATAGGTTMVWYYADTVSWRGIAIAIREGIPPVTLPTVTVQAVDQIEKTTARGNGNITDTGGENCTKRGFVYGTTSKSDPGNVAPGSSGYDTYVEDTGDYGVGAFTKTLISLVKGQTYYVRAYAYNSEGYEYSDSEVSFTAKTDYKLTKSLKYCVIQTPSAITKLLKYTSYQAVAINKTLKYCVITTPTKKTKSLKYNIFLGSTKIEKGLIYKALPSIKIEKGLIYKVLPSIAINKSLKYTVITTPTKLTKSLEYIISIVFNIQKSLKYSIFLGATAIQKGLIYKALVQYYIPLSLRYTITITPTKIEKSLKYVVETTPAAIDKSLKYTVIATPSAKEKSLRYTILTIPSALTKGLEYRVLTIPSAITKGLEYQVLTEIKIEKDLHYEVITEQAITKSLKYCVITPIAITKSLEYQVITTPSAIEKLLHYEVLVEVSITKSLKYCVIQTPSAKTKALKYVVKSYPYDRFSVPPYTPTTSPYVPLNKG